MSGKKQKTKGKSVGMKNTGRPFGLSDEEYEEYLERVREEKQKAEIEAERQRMKEGFDGFRTKIADMAHGLRKEKRGAVRRGKDHGCRFSARIRYAVKKTDEKIILPVSDFADAFFAKTADFLYRLALPKGSVLLFIAFAFAVIVINNFVCGLDPFVLFPHVAEGTYQYYLCDYSCGFVSRVLIGAIITHFTDSVTVELIGAITSVANILSLLLDAVLIGVGMRYSLTKRKESCFVICVSALVCPFISVWCSTNYGLLDVFLLLCFLLAAFAENSTLRCAVPAIFCAVGLCIQYSFMFSFAPALLCVLFFGIFYSQKNKKSYIVGFALAAAVTAGLFIWFAVFATDHVKCTADEFNALMHSRFVIPASLKERLEPYYQLAVANPDLTAAEKQIIKESLYNSNAIYEEYFNHYIFHIYDGQTASGMGDFFANQFAYNARFRKLPEMFLYLLFACPFILYSLINSGRRFIRAKGIGKLPFLAVFAASLQIIPALILSVDTIRFITSAVISALYMNYIIEMNMPRSSAKKQCRRGVRRSFLCLSLLLLWGGAIVFFKSVLKQMTVG